MKIKNTGIFEQKVLQTIKKYNLAKKKDKILVALSGGKDSTSVLYILKKEGFDVSALMIDLHLGKWSEKHKENMQRFCSELKVPLHIVDLRKELGSGICFIKQVVKEKKNLSGCTVCGVIKKWILNKYAKKLGATKLATGHNLDDEVQTVLMNFLKGNLYLGIGSKPATGKIQNNEKRFVQRIKPLFFMPEEEIRDYSKAMKFPVLYEKCPCAFGTYRIETRSWMRELNLSSKEKLKIVSGFQKIIPQLEKRQEKRELRECRICGEPSSHDVCNACGILSCVKKF